MAVDVGAVLTRAYHIVLQNRALWVLGFLAALLAGSGQFNYRLEPNDQIQIGDWSLASNVGMLVGAAVSALLLGIALFVLRSWVDAALIAGGNQDPQAPTPTFRAAWRQGGQYLGPVIALNLIFMGVMLVFVVALAALLGMAIGLGILSGLLTGQLGPELPGLARAMVGIGVGGAALLLVLVVAVPLAVALSVTTQLAQRAAVLDGRSVGAAWSSGWALTRANRGPVVLALLAQWLVGLVAGVAALLVALPFIGGPLLLLTRLGSSPDAGSLGVALLLLVIGWPLVAAVGALPAAWNSVVWTQFYRAATVGLPAMPGRQALLRDPLPPAGYSR